ncbi:hypothetical protein ACQ4PT_060368 [Festuca glaucescens]
MLGDPDALRFIWQEHDVAAIVHSVKAGNNFVVIYIDHDETLGAFDLDDVAAYAPAELPPVFLSPQKVEQQQQQGASGQVYDVPIDLDAAPVRRGMRGWGREYIDLGDDSGGAASDVEDEDYQLEIVDSDYDISRDDDDLLEDQLMADVKKKCRDVDIGMKEKRKQLAEDSDEDVQLQEPDLDDEAVKYNFLAFGEEDMANPTFRTRHTFASIEILRQTIKEYRCKQRRKISMPKHDKTRITVICLGNLILMFLEAQSYPCSTDLTSISQPCSRDATVNDVPAEFDVQGYPTLYFVTPSGKMVSYDGGRIADEIVDYIKKNKETAGQAAAEATEKAAASEPLKNEL